MDIELTIDKYGVTDITDRAVENIVTAAVLSCLIEKGGWWQSPNFGSRLHTLRRSKLTEDKPALVKNYLKEALNWLTERGLAETIEIETERRGRERIDYTLTIYQGDTGLVFKNSIGAAERDFYGLDNVYREENIYEIG